MDILFDKTIAELALFDIAILAIGVIALALSCYNFGRARGLNEAAQMLEDLAEESQARFKGAPYE